MEVPRHWRLKKQRYALVGETCPVCKSHLFPPREVCPYCTGAKSHTAGLRKQEAAITVTEPAVQAVR